MAVYFKRPDTKPNWRKALDKLIPAAPSAASLAAAAATPAAPLAFAASLVGFGAGAQKAVRDAVEAAAPDNTVDERAWVWLRVTLTVAVLELLGTPRLRSPLDTSERKDAAKRFLAEALDLNGEGTLDIPTLVNPASCPLIAPVMAGIPELARAIAPEHTLEDNQLRAELARLLRATAFRVYALDTPYYRAVADAVTGPFSEGARRDLAWARHEDWIRGLFHREPIFSPDADETIPLSAVYHRLRCFWHEEAPSEGGRERDDRRPRPRIAHVADLHETLHDWLRTDAVGDSIRVVAGGPGSGKSSFSRAFAVEVIEAGDHRVIYVPLQHMSLGADLRDRIGRRLRERWHATDPAGGAGFEQNPLDWWSWENLPYLLVFDGLDELTHDDDTARDLARKFVRSVHSMLASLAAGGPRVRALILGRSAACQEALDEIELDLRQLVHVAPLTRLIEGERPAAVLGSVATVENQSGRADQDERPAFWWRSATSRGIAPEPTPEAVIAGELHELNAEPLLLHLLIVSGYTGANWREAAENRNLVYRAIFRSVFARNKAKDHPATRNIDEDDFFTLLECLGLAAWRGNGRTVSEQDFASVRDLHATGRQRRRFGTLPAAELRNVAIQFHIRRDADTGGFEFIHKSFGEYLAARGLLSAGLRYARLMSADDDPRPEAEIASRLSDMIAGADLTEEIVQFLFDEARLLREGDLQAALPPLTRVFNWGLQHGMPVHALPGGASFRQLEARQRCAESALFAAVSAVNLGRKGEHWGAPLWCPIWRTEVDRRGVIHFLHRTRATDGHAIRLTLTRLNFDIVTLTSANLAGANLSSSELSHSSLIHAILDGANLSHAKLHASNLRGVSMRGANLTRASISEATCDRADFSDAILDYASFYESSLRAIVLLRASLRGTHLYDSKGVSQSAIDSAFGVREGIGRTHLPDGLRYPDHWHTGENAKEDSHEAVEAYSAAYREWVRQSSGRGIFVVG